MNFAAFTKVPEARTAVGPSILLPGIVVNMPQPGQPLTMGEQLKEFEAFGMRIAVRKATLQRCPAPNYGTCVFGQSIQKSRMLYIPIRSEVSGNAKNSGLRCRCVYFEVPPMKLGSKNRRMAKLSVPDNPKG